MLNGTMASDESDIAIPDIEPDAFLALLKFLYLDDVTIESESVIATLYTGTRIVLLSILSIY
jgi:BTB/POZ domain-containing protein 3/6